MARLSIQSRLAGADSGHEVQVEGGQAEPLRPCAMNAGTIVEVRDLFFATPARLKFLKGERAETGAITEVVKRIAVAFPAVRFGLSGPDRATLELAATGEDRLARIGQILGAEFADNAIAVDAERESVRLSGLCRCADLQPRQFAAPVLLRQRTPGTGQVAAVGTARSL